MNRFIGAHYFSLPTQGNIYSITHLPLTSGKSKTLIATLKRKVYSCQFLKGNNSVLPVIKEVPFTYIPSGAEIISIDAFNRSDSSDIFFVGITIIKVNADQSIETYLNIYSEQDVEEKMELNLENLAQNCLMMELAFTPYQLHHTLLINLEKSNEIVWLLSGSDLKIHLFREDPLNHTYCEIETNNLFPEFSNLPSIVLWMDIKYTSDFQRRLTAFGCENGTVKCFLIDVKNNYITLNLSKHFDAPISKVILFKVNEEYDIPCMKYIENLKTSSKKTQSSDVFNLLVVNTIHASVVYMGVINDQLNRMLILPDSNKYDASICATIADINMDSNFEILIGSYFKVLLVYCYEDDVWKLDSTHKFPHSIHSIDYIDLTGDGIKELVVVTLHGVNIYQHNLLSTLNKFQGRFKKMQRKIKHKDY